MKEPKSAAQTVKDEIGKDTVGCIVAVGLIACFAGSLGFGFYLVCVLVKASLAYEAAERSTAIKDALQILTTIGTLFSPLLAFVLGYYFHQSQATQSEAARQQAESGGSGDTSKAAEKPGEKPAETKVTTVTE